MILVVVGIAGTGFKDTRTLSTKPDSSLLVIGRRCSDFFISGIHEYSASSVSLDKFNSEYIVFDFWSLNCASCLASFPRINELQKNFKNVVQFFMIGIKDRRNEIEQVYERYKEKEGLEMAYTFDSSVSKKWGIRQTPFVVVMSRDGIVRYVSESIDSSTLDAIVKGAYLQKNKSERIPFNSQRMYLVSGNGGVDSEFEMRSLFSKFDPERQQSMVPGSIFPFVKYGQFQVLGANVKELFSLAYLGDLNPGGSYGGASYGKYWRFPVFENEDDSTAAFGLDGRAKLYAYSLKLPQSRCTYQLMERIMQRDLESYFGFVGHIEYRKMLCWKMIASKEVRERLATKGGPEKVEGSYELGVQARNIPFALIMRYLSQHFSKEIILDFTKINGNVDISFEGPWITMEDARDALKLSGIRLIKVYVPIKVLTIKEELDNEVIK